MLPIVFPHTYLSQRVMQILTKVFDRIGVYLPSELQIPEQMQHWADSDMLELRIPAPGDEARLAEVLKAFRSWAAMQSDGPGFDVDLLKAYHSQAPFIDAPFASQIRTDIGRRMAPLSSKEGQKAEIDRLLSARIFLSIAQQLDEQADTLDKDFAAVDARRQDMLRELQDGLPDSPANEPPIPVGSEEPGVYMLTERMQAWAWLAAVDAAQSGSHVPALLVTAGREVLEWVIDRLPDDAIVDRSKLFSVSAENSEAMAGWRRDFLQAIISLATGSDEPADPMHSLPEPPPVDVNQARLQVEVVRLPHKFVAEVLGVSLPSPSAAEQTAAATENTVILVVEPTAEL